MSFKNHLFVELHSVILENSRVLCIRVCWNQNKFPLPFNLEGDAYRAKSCADINVLDHYDLDKKSERGPFVCSAPPAFIMTTWTGSIDKMSGHCSCTSKACISRAVTRTLQWSLPGSTSQRGSFLEEEIVAIHFTQGSVSAHSRVTLPLPKRQYSFKKDYRRHEICPYGS